MTDYLELEFLLRKIVGSGHNQNELHEGITPCDANRKKMRSSRQLFRAHQQSIPQLLSLASQVYKGYQERSTGSELMRFIPTRLCHWYVLTMPRHSWFGA